MPVTILVVVAAFILFLIIVSIRILITSRKKNEKNESFIEILKNGYKPDVLPNSGRPLDDQAKSELSESFEYIIKSMEVNDELEK